LRETSKIDLEKKANNEQQIRLAAINQDNKNRGAAKCSLLDTRGDQENAFLFLNKRKKKEGKENVSATGKSGRSTNVLLRSFKKKKKRLDKCTQKDVRDMREEEIKFPHLYTKRNVL
jgi:hypothetical protein